MQLYVATLKVTLSPEEYLLTPNLEPFNMQIKVCIKIYVKINQEGRYRSYREVGELWGTSPTAVMGI